MSDPAPPSELVVGPARVEEREPAFRLIFQHQPAEEHDTRVEMALGLVNKGELAPDCVLVARQGGSVVGAMLCQPVPGASGLVWPPQVPVGDRQGEWEDRLIQEAIAWLRRRGAKLGQALLQPREAHLAAPLERNGFAHITRLWYMRRSVRASDRKLQPSGHLTFQPYTHGDREQFHQTLLRTYEGTMDCPEVNGVRDLDEIITGHRAQGIHDPERWWLVQESDQPAGVLMMTEMPEWTAWEVSYVGVVPAARGRGLGREVMTRALAEAEAAAVIQVTLSVDERNRPAWKLYLDLGFEPYEQREVYLAIWKKE